MHQAKSGRCRFWIKFLGRTTWSGRWCILVEVEHVGTPHEERKNDMSHFEKFITEGNEKADELATGGALLDKEFMKEARAETLQQERDKVYAAAVCGQLPLLSRTMKGL